MSQIKFSCGKKHSELGLENFIGAVKKMWSKIILISSYTGISVLPAV